MSDAGIPTRAFTTLRHNQSALALHGLRSATRAGEEAGARPLLVLHGLGGRTPATAPEWADAWDGPVFGLDFTGHGDSTLPVGGGYSAEILMADADAALAHLGPSTIVGFGLGAYVALLIAGGRPGLVRGAVLCDGPGLAGGATHPTSLTVLEPRSPADRTPDPWALVELSNDLRPPDYATTFVRLAFQGSDLDAPIITCIRSKAPWADAVRDEPGVQRVATLAEALTLLA